MRFYAAWWQDIQKIYKNDPSYFFNRQVFCFISYASKMLLKVTFGSLSLQQQEQEQEQQEQLRQFLDLLSQVKMTTFALETASHFRRYWAWNLV